MGLLKAVMRLSMTSLKGADAKDIASSITAIANEKIKAEKEANAGKKKTGSFILDQNLLCCFCIWVIFVSSFCGVFKVFVVYAGGKKKQLHVDKPDEDFVAEPYDALDDYDFM